MNETNIKRGYSVMVRDARGAIWINGNYPEKCPAQIWKRYIANSPYRSFNFQQLFFYDIFLRNAYFTSYRSSKYTTVGQFFTDFLA